jgi:tetratricopeptide (TPR) repeat protein
MSLRFRERVLRAAEAVETSPMTLGQWLLMLAAIIVLRHFLEQLSGHQKTLYFLSYFIHYPLAYIAPLLSLSVVLSALSRERIERVTKLMLFAWVLTLVPPLIDILVSRGGQERELIGYLIPTSGTLMGAFLNLFNPAYQQFQGATAGIRIEAAAGCLLGALYVQLKTRSLWRAVATFAAVYVTMFFFFALPVIAVAVSRAFGANIENVYQLLFARASVHRAFADATPFGVSDLSNSLIDLIVIAPLLAIWYRMFAPERVALLRRLADPPTALLHLVTTFAGVALGARLLMGSRGLVSVAHPFDVVAIVGLLAAAFFTAVTASALRELNREADPLAPEESRALRMIGVTAFVLAGFFALSVSYVALTYVMSMVAVYCLYYVRPIRLVRFTPLAGLAIGGVTLFSTTLGYAAYAGGSASLWLPIPVAVACVAVPALALLARDVWQPSGSDDRWNLSSVVGQRQARVVAAGGVLLAGLVVAFAVRGSAAITIGAVAGVLGAAAALALPARRVPGALTALGAVAIAVGLVAGGLNAPSLSQGLEETDFARVSRRSGEFELYDRAPANEEERVQLEGLERFNRGDYEGAIDSFKRLAELDPQNAGAYVSVGSAYLRLNRVTEAANSFRRALSIDPDDAGAHVGLGQALKLGGNPDQALEELARASELDPTNSDAHFTASLIHRELGDTGLEQDELLATVAVDPRHSAAQSRLADIYLANGKYEEAIAALKASLTGRKPAEYIHTRLASAYYELGDLKGAENELRKEIALRPKLASPHANLAHLLAELGRTDEAVHEYREALSLTTDERMIKLLEDELSRIKQ